MAGRRGNSEGSITKRSDGRWESRITLTDGTRKSFYGKTQKVVQEKLKQAQRQVDDGLPLVDQRKLLGPYFESWLDSMRYQVDPSSWERYRTLVNCHIVPKLGKISLAKLTTEKCQSFYAEKIDDGNSSASVHQMHNVLHHGLKDALRLGIVQRNVTDLAKAPRVQTRAMKVLSELEARSFLSAIAGERLYALYVLALSTGMRRGELLALRWQDVNLEGSSLQVHMGLQRNGSGKFVLAEPKSSHSKRRIVLSKTVISALRHHHVRQLEEKLILGSSWDIENNFVFPNTVGTQMHPSFISDADFPRLVKRTGLPNIRFHDLRHTAATILISRGVNVKVVSEMLGHSDVAITLRVYTHVMPNMQQVAADVMDAVFVG